MFPDFIEGEVKDESEEKKEEKMTWCAIGSEFKNVDKKCFLFFCEVKNNFIRKKLALFLLQKSGFFNLQIFWKNQNLITIGLDYENWD